MVILQILNIIIVVIIVLLAIGFILAGIVLTKYLYTFYTKKCSCCGHRMFYKGSLKEDDTEYYLFFCTHCKKREKVNINTLIDSV